MSAPTSSLFQTFKRDQEGSVALIFGAAAIMVVMFVGAAIDAGRVFHARSAVNSAADAAALSAAKALRIEGKTKPQAIAIGKATFNANMLGAAGRWAVIAPSDLEIDVNGTTQEITVDVRAHVNMTFASVLGITKMDMHTRAAALFEKKDIEVSLQLDLTGSMCDAGPAPCTSDPKIQGLKDATKALIQVLLPNTPGPQKVRIAMAPYTAGVNVGSFQSQIANGSTSADTCVYERASATNQASDNAPSGTDSFMVKADLLATFGTAPRASCPASEIVPLTDSKTILNGAVDAFVADGYTAGHNGTAWAWNLLSPNWSSIWPTTSQAAAYNDINTIKTAILMTDGEYNTMNGKSADATTVSQVAIDTCNAMKAAGIKVYTVGFALGGNTTAIDTLAACASNAGSFYQAATTEELTSVFKTIANNIMTLRLTS